MSIKLTNRLFVYISIASFTFFSLFHLLVWENFTKFLLKVEKTMYVGDLARIGYQFNSIEFRKTEVTLPRQHIKSADWRGEDVDIVTFGDSFSIGGAGGLNPYYQDFIASEHNVSILNIERDTKIPDEHYLNALIAMINGGFFDKLKPKIVILESVERLALVRLSKDVDWNATTSVEDAAKDMKANAFCEENSNIPIINTGNYKFFLYNFYYRFSHNAFGRSAVHRYTLNRDFFNSNRPDLLLFYDQDITSLGMINESNVKKMNDNLNRITQLLEEKNIKLIFMPAVDKYDLYYKYINGNQHDENKFFDLLRPLSKKYYFVDTKKVLSPLVENNVTDIFYGDDTHWSYKAAYEVVKSIPISILLDFK